MNDPRLLPDDPRLTAYALGELSGDERAAVEAALRLNPALRVAVDEIRTTAALMEAALAGETIARPMDNAAARPGIVIELNGHATAAANGRPAAMHSVGQAVRGNANDGARTDYRLPRSRPKLLRFPQFYYVVATVAAACFAMVVTFRESPRKKAKPVERIIRHEIVLLPPPPNTVEALPAAASVPPAADMRVASAGRPANSPDSSATPTGTIESARPGPSGTPAFIDGDLSLISQAKPGPDTAGTTKSVIEFGATGFGRTAVVAESPALLSTGSTAAGSAPAQASGAQADRQLQSAVPLLGTTVTSGSEIAVNAGALPAAPVHFDALTPPVAAPVVAAATPPSVVPNATNRNGQSGGAMTATGAGDVIVLSAFTVTADRAVGFATQGTEQRIGADRRGPARHDDLPAPPPGAKFGRNAEAYSYIRDNDFVRVAQNRRSTFSIDVDTASYANVRRIIEHGSPPPRDAVRIEEMLNYFPYRYAAPKGDAPFAATLEVAAAPWAPTHQLVRIGLKAREVPPAQRPPASLVFLLDVSGSMNQANKLPLVQQSLRMLVGRLRPDDRVAIVTYAGNSGLALPSTPVAQSRDILNALDALVPGGSTNGAMGIQLAYEIAKANFVRDGINRVILCTDGDFNVGPTSEGELARLIEEKATSGVFLTVLGFGMGNYKDATLEKLADKGNGNYGYIDTRREAEKMLVEQVSGTLMTVAKDVKVQVDFNPANVSKYRLIGYENRLLRKEDFNSDSVDAGEIGAGHTVTALYEIVPVGADDRTGGNVPPVDELRYASRPRLETPAGKRDAHSDELLVVKVRYKKPDSLFGFPKTLEFPLLNASRAFASASADFRFAAAVAQFGMMLRGSPHRGAASIRDVASWAATAAATPEDDPGGYRGEFIELVRKAQVMME